MCKITINSAISGKKNFGFIEIGEDLTLFGELGVVKVAN